MTSKATPSNNATSKGSKGAQNKQQGRNHSVEEFTLENVEGVSCATKNALASNPTNGNIAFAASSVLVVLDPRYRRQDFLENPTGRNIRALTYSDDGKFVAFGEAGYNPSVYIYTATDRKSVSNFQIPGICSVKAMEFHPNSVYIAILSGSSYGIDLFNLKGRKLATATFVVEPLGMTVPKVGSYLVVCGHRKLSLFSLMDVDANVYHTNIVFDRRSVILGHQSDYTFVDVASGSGQHKRKVYTVTSCGYLCDIKVGDILIDRANKIDEYCFCVKYGLGCVFVGCAKNTVRICSPVNLSTITSISDRDIFFPKLSQPSILKFEANTVAVTVNCATRVVTCVFSDHHRHSWRIGLNDERLECLAIKPIDEDGNEVSCQPTSFEIQGKVANVLNNIPTQKSPKSGGNRDTAVEKKSSPNDNGGSGSGGGGGTDTDGLMKTNHGFRMQPKPSAPIYVNATRFTPDGKVIICGNAEGEIKIFDALTGRLSRVIEAHSAAVTNIELLFDDHFQLVASGGRDRVIFILDVQKDYSLVQVLCDHSSAIVSISMAHLDGTLTLVSSAADGVILIRRAIKRKQLRFVIIGELSEFGGKPRIYAYGNEYIITSGDNGQINLFQTEPFISTKPTKVIKSSSRGKRQMKAVTIDPSGSFLVASSTSGTIVFDIQSGKHVATLTKMLDVSLIRFTPDCKYLITESNDGCRFSWLLPFKMTEVMKSKKSPAAPSREIPLPYEKILSCIDLNKEKAGGSGACGGGVSTGGRTSEVLTSKIYYEKADTDENNYMNVTPSACESYSSCSTCSRSYTDIIRCTGRKNNIQSTIIHNNSPTNMLSEEARRLLKTTTNTEQYTPSNSSVGGDSTPTMDAFSHIYSDKEKDSQDSHSVLGSDDAIISKQHENSQDTDTSVATAQTYTRDSVTTRAAYPIAPPRITDVKLANRGTPDLGRKGMSMNSKRKAPQKTSAMNAPKMFSSPKTTERGGKNQRGRRGSSCAMSITSQSPEYFSVASQLSGKQDVLLLDDHDSDTPGASQTMHPSESCSGSNDISIAQPVCQTTCGANSLNGITSLASEALMSDLEEQGSTKPALVSQTKTTPQSIAVEKCPAVNVLRRDGTETLSANMWRQGSPGRPIPNPRTDIGAITRYPSPKAEFVLPRKSPMVLERKRIPSLDSASRLDQSEDVGERNKEKKEEEKQQKQSTYLVQQHQQKQQLEEEGVYGSPKDKEVFHSVKDYYPVSDKPDLDDGKDKGEGAFDSDNPLKQTNVGKVAKNETETMGATNVLQEPNDTALNGVTQIDFENKVPNNDIKSLAIEQEEKGVESQEGSLGEDDDCSISARRLVDQILRRRSSIESDTGHDDSSENASIARERSPLRLPSYMYSERQNKKDKSAHLSNSQETVMSLQMGQQDSEGQDDQTAPSTDNTLLDSIASNPEEGDETKSKKSTTGTGKQNPKTIGGGNNDGVDVTTTSTAVVDNVGTNVESSPNKDCDDANTLSVDDDKDDDVVADSLYDDPSHKQKDEFKQDGDNNIDNEAIIAEEDDTLPNLLSEKSEAQHTNNPQTTSIASVSQAVTETDDGESKSDLLSSKNLLEIRARIEEMLSMRRNLFKDGKSDDVSDGSDGFKHDSRDALLKTLLEKRLAASKRSQNKTEREEGEASGTGTIASVKVHESPPEKEEKEKSQFQQAMNSLQKNSSFQSMKTSAAQKQGDIRATNTTGQPETRTSLRRSLQKRGRSLEFVKNVTEDGSLRRIRSFKDQPSPPTPKTKPKQYHTPVTSRKLPGGVSRVKTVMKKEHRPPEKGLTARRKDGSIEATTGGSDVYSSAYGRSTTGTQYEPTRQDIKGTAISSIADYQRVRSKTSAKQTNGHKYSDPQANSDQMIEHDSSILGDDKSVSVSCKSRPSTSSRRTTTKPPLNSQSPPDCAGGSSAIKEPKDPKSLSSSDNSESAVMIEGLGSVGDLFRNQEKYLSKLREVRRNFEMSIQALRDDRKNLQVGLEEFSRDDDNDSNVKKK